MTVLGITPEQWAVAWEIAVLGIIGKVAHSFWTVATETRDAVKDLHGVVVGPKLHPEAGLLARMERVEASLGFHVHRRRTDRTAEGEM